MTLSPGHHAARALDASTAVTPSTTHGGDPGWRGAPVATTMASSVRCCALGGGRQRRLGAGLLCRPRHGGRRHQLSHPRQCPAGVRPRRQRGGGLARSDHGLRRGCAEATHGSARCLPGEDISDSGLLLPRVGELEGALVQLLLEVGSGKVAMPPRDRWRFSALSLHCLTAAFFHCCRRPSLRRPGRVAMRTTGCESRWGLLSCAANKR